MTGSAILPKVRPNYKLERNTVIYSRWIAGESTHKLARAYEISATSILKIVNNHKSKIQKGELPPVKPNYE